MLARQIDQIKQTVTIADVLSRYGFEVNSKNTMACPFHSEKTPSFKVYPDSNSFYCFGCGEGGDVLDFVRKYFELDFNQAKSKLGFDFGIATPQKLTYRQKIEMRKANQEREKEKWLKENRKLYSNYAYVCLCCYHKWLLKQPKTQATQFDVEYISRLLEMYLSSEKLIDWDIKARLTALMSKHTTDRKEVIA